MAYFVYGLCSITSLGCASLLMRAYFYNKTRLLFWSSLCFGCIAINNILLFVDFSLGPGYDLSLIRSGAAVIGMTLMMYGLIWDTV